MIHYEDGMAFDEDGNRIVTEQEIEDMEASLREWQEMQRAPYPVILVCHDPENCGQMHNEHYGDESDHHYGCECSECLEFYRSLK